MLQNDSHSGKAILPSTIHNERQNKASSTRQAKALARNIKEKMTASGIDVIGIEGESEGDWVLVDLGDIVVHIMTPATRAYFNLEELWSS